MVFLLGILKIHILFSDVIICGEFLITKHVETGLAVPWKHNTSARGVIGCINPNEHVIYNENSDF